MERINLNFCSFCRKVPRDTQFMIAGPDGVNLCDECVGICAKIIAEAKAKKPVARHQKHRQVSA